VDGAVGYTSTVILPDISIGAGGLLEGLGLSGESVTGVVGEARSLLQVPPWADAGVVFQVRRERRGE
jgi:hypothetical protein